MNSIRFIHLTENQLCGKRPVSLKTCSKLGAIDLGENKFSGIIPVWFGKSYANLKILRLRSNNFEGSIPHQLSLMTSLQVLDISSKFVRGKDTAQLWKSCVHEVSANQWSNRITWRTTSGLLLRWQINIVIEVTRVVSKVLSVFKSIDLSNNNLTGKIPVTNLSAHSCKTKEYEVRIGFEGSR